MLIYTLQMSSRIAPLVYVCLVQYFSVFLVHGFFTCLINYSCLYRCVCVCVCFETTCSSCGVFVAALCGEEGCHDPGTGDYDVIIPADVEPGEFSLYVQELSEIGPSDCATFNVVRDPGVSRVLCLSV